MAKTQKKLVRILSLGEDFMSWKQNDLIYAYLLYSSTLKKTGKKIISSNGKEYDETVLYLLRDKYLTEKENIAIKCKFKTTKAVEAELRKLINKGLITEGTIEIYGKQKKCLYFKTDYDEKFQIVNNDILWFLIDTCQTHVVQIYTYLLNKYQYAKKIGFNYEFTLKELRDVLGYRDREAGNLMLNNVLFLLYRIGAINYNIEWKKNEDLSIDVPYLPKHVLYHVAESKAEMPNERRLMNLTDDNGKEIELSVKQKKIIREII